MSVCGAHRESRHSPGTLCFGMSRSRGLEAGKHGAGRLEAVKEDSQQLVEGPLVWVGPSGVSCGICLSVC